MTTSPLSLVKHVVTVTVSVVTTEVSRGALVVKVGLPVHLGQTVLVVVIVSVSVTTPPVASVMQVVIVSVMQVV